MGFILFIGGMVILGSIGGVLFGLPGAIVGAVASAVVDFAIMAARS